MSETTIVAPSWMQQMRRIEGTLEAPGSADNPIILSWGGVIAKKFPQMAEYCRNYKHDETAWCGYSMGYCFAMADMMPPYDPADDLHSFMWAQSWKRLPGSRLSKPILGCILVLARHVTQFVRMSGSNYVCLGGNQGDAVKESTFSPGSIEMMIWPSNVAAITLPGTTMFSTKHSNLWLQRSLNILSGELTKLLDEDNEYGTDTYNVVKDFQRAYNLPMTGIAGARDVAAVEAELKFRRLVVSDV